MDKPATKIYHTSPASMTGPIRKITIVGLIINIILSSIKLLFGYIGGSQALIADAFHSLSDISTDIAVLWGAHVWTKPPDESHPYGHQRIETIVTMIISTALMGVGIGIGYKALSTILTPHIQSPKVIALFAGILSVISKEILYRKTVIVGKAAHSSAVIANAWHHRSDALSSIPVVIAISLAIVDPRLIYLDHLGAFVVSLFILHAGWVIMKPALQEITDTGASSKLIREIEKTVQNIKGVQSFHALRTRKFGSGWYIDIDVQVDPLMTVQDGHEISEKVKNVLIKRNIDILDVMVHLEPFIS